MRVRGLSTSSRVTDHQYLYQYHRYSIHCIYYHRRARILARQWPPSATLYSSEMSSFQFEYKKENAELSNLFVNSDKGYVWWLIVVLRWNCCSRIVTLDVPLLSFRCEWYSLTDDLTNEVHGLGIEDLHSVTAQFLTSPTLTSSDETSISIEDPLHYSSLIPVKS